MRSHNGDKKRRRISVRLLPGLQGPCLTPISYKVITDKSSLLNQIMGKSSLPVDKPVDKPAAVGVERPCTSVSRFIRPLPSS